MSSIDRLIEAIAQKIAQASGDDANAVRALLVDNPEEFETKYGQYLSPEEKRFLGMD
jgi:hypothetical protein